MAAMQFADLGSVRSFVDKATTSLAKTSRLTSTLGSTSRGLGELNNLASNLSSRVTQVNNAIGIVQNISGTRLLSDLNNDIGSLVGQINGLRALPNIPATSMLGLNNCLSQVASARRVLSSVQKITNAALGNSKIASNNALSNFCTGFADKIRGALNQVQGMVASLARTITSMVNQAVSAINDAVSAGIEGLEDMIQQGLDELRKLLPDIDIPDVVNMLLPDWLRSVPSMLNKALSPLKDLLQGIASCIGTIDSLIDDGFGAIDSLGNIVNSAGSILDKPLSVLQCIRNSKSTLDYMLDSIKYGCKQDSLIAKSQLLSSTAFYTVGPYLDDLFGTSSSSLLGNLNSITTELTKIRNEWIQQGDRGTDVTKLDSVLDHIEVVKADIPVVLPQILDSTKAAIESVENTFEQGIDEIVTDTQDSLDDIKEDMDNVFDIAESLSEDFVTTPEVEAFITECQASKAGLL